MRTASRVLAAIVAIGSATSATACSDSLASNCVRAGEAKICYLPDNAAAGRLDVSGLAPGSTLTVSSQQAGESTYTINSAGTVDGTVGIINGNGGAMKVTVTGTTETQQELVATFEP